MNDTEPDYNDLDSSWTIDFKEILNNLDYDEDTSLSEFLLELNEEDENESDKHPLSELIKDTH